MLVDFFLLRRKRYDLRSLYSRTGQYAYQAGWNVRGLTALAIGLVAALAGNIVPGLGGLADYAWFIGLAVGAIAYYVAMLPDASVVHAREHGSGVDPIEHEDVAAALELA
jgi:NCS1 family nucleobase:cation symporter-1